MVQTMVVVFAKMSEVTSVVLPLRPESTLITSSGVEFPNTHLCTEARNGNYTCTGSMNGEYSQFYANFIRICEQDSLPLTSRGNTDHGGRRPFQGYLGSRGQADGFPVYFKTATDVNNKYSNEVRFQILCYLIRNPLPPSL